MHERSFEMTKLKQLARGVALIGKEEDVWIEYAKKTLKITAASKLRHRKREEATLERSRHSGNLDYVVMALVGDVMIPLDTICVISTETCEHHPVVGITGFVKPVCNTHSHQIAD